MSNATSIGSSATMLLADILRRYRIRFGSERELQGCIAKILDEQSIKFEREVKLSKESRIDFLIPAGVGIEVKVDAATSAVIRQLHRYSEQDKITGLVLVTNRAKHRSIPKEMNGKRVELVFLGGI